MEDGMAERDIHQKICAREAGGPFIKELAEAKTKGQTDRLYVNNSDLTLRESGDPDEENVKQWLIVGYAKRETDPELTKKCKAYKGWTGFGTYVPEGLEVIPWVEDEPPVIVVTDVTSPPGAKGRQLYGLLRSSKELRTPFQIAQDQVFYRYEYRDVTTSMNKRGSNWNQLLNINGTNSEKTFVNANTSGDHEFLDQTLRLAPKFSLANELFRLEACFISSHNFAFLDEMRSVLKSVDPDLNAQPLPQSKALRMLFTGDELFDHQMAAEFIKEFGEIWDDSTLNTDTIIRIHRGLLKSGAFLGYNLLYAVVKQSAFLIQEAMIIDNCETTAEKDAELVLSAIASARRMVPSKPGSRVFTSDQQDLLLRLVLEKLRVLQKAGREMEEAIKQDNGDFEFLGSTQDIWKPYESSSDADTTRVAFTTMTQVLTAAVLQRDQSVLKMVEELITVLEKALLK